MNTPKINSNFKVTDDWSKNGGFTGAIELTNKGNEVEDWTVEFEADFEIQKIWNAEIVSHVGNRYVIKNGRWNDEIETGETVKFGFSAGVDNKTINKPLNYKLNQQELDNNLPDITPTPFPKTPKITPPTNNLSPQAISVGFEQHNAGRKYGLNDQKKDWKVGWSQSSWMDNYAKITNDESHTGNKALRITHRPDVMSGGSANWKLPSQKEYYLQYSVMFEDDFDFDGSKQSGGKLPGLAGAGGLCSNGQTCNGNNGFSARYMWGKEGRAKLYLYHMDKPTKWGENFWFQDSDGEDIFFEPGEWHTLTQRVRINDGNKRNGSMDVWMDGEQVLDIDGLQFVNNNKGVDSVMFSTFHGGNSKGFLPDSTVFSYYDDFVVSGNARDVGL